MTARLVAEALGTFLLVFTVGCNVLTGTKVWGGTSIASVLMVSIYALGGISGANFNPAVSCALALTKKMGGPGLEIDVALKYAGAQLVAGAAAAISYSALLGDAFQLSPSKGFGVVHAWMAEILYTFMLCFVVLNVAAASRVTPNQYYGLAIGFVIIAGAYGAGAISGGCFNPAVAFGIDISSVSMGFGWSIDYVLAELIGASLAAFAFKMVRPEEFGQEFPAKEYVSEFLGTYMLVLTVGLNVLASSSAAAFSIAASLMCMIYALGDVSGAHFNPAVTLAIFGSGRDRNLTPGKTGAYMCVQVLGAVVAGFTYSFMHQLKAFPLGPQPGFSLLQALLAEVMFTFVLAYVVLAVAVSNTTKSPLMFGLAIGSCVTVGGNAIGAVSGGSLNPAVSIGIQTTNVAMGGSGIARALSYVAAEMVGGAAAATVFEMTHKVDRAEKSGQDV